MHTEMKMKRSMKRSNNCQAQAVKKVANILRKNGETLNFSNRVHQEMIKKVRDALMKKMKMVKRIGNNGKKSKSKSKKSKSKSRKLY